MGQDIEYHDAMINMLELIWGAGYMTPGGTGQTDRLVEGLDLDGRRVLDIGSGLGGPACHLAARHGARVTGVDIEQQLIDLSAQRAQAEGLASRARFLRVDPGPLPFADASFDLVISSGALTQIADKSGLFSECLRVLAPGGAMHNFEWTTSADTTSEDMRYFFRMEGLTYALETPAAYRSLLTDAGFDPVDVRDDTGWYLELCRREYESMKGELYGEMLQVLGREDADHFVENWRSLVVVFENGELTQTICRSRKPL